MPRLSSVVMVAAVAAAGGLGADAADPLSEALSSPPAGLLTVPEPVNMAAVQAIVHQSHQAIAAPSKPSFSLGGLMTRLKAKTSSLSSSSSSSPFPSSLLEAGASASASAAAGSVPVEDQLPSMSPMDGLDLSLANGPLPNPRPLKGEPNQEVPGFPSMSSQALPSAGEVLGTAPPQGKMYLTPGLNLPPIYGGEKTLPSPAEADATANLLKMPSHPGLPGHADLERVETPAHAAFTNHPWRVSEAVSPEDFGRQDGGGLLRAPYVAPPLAEWHRAYQEMTGAAMPNLPLFHGHVLSGDVHAPTSAFEAFQHEKSRLEQERAHYLAELKKRHAAIEHARSFVVGGSAWVNKMKAEWDAWLEKERAKGSSSIVAEQKKVEQQQHVLDALERQQHEDMKRINLYNSKIRQAAIQFKLQQHRASLEKAAAQQNDLKERLAASQKHQAEVEARIAEMSQKMKGETGETDGEQEAPQKQTEEPEGGGEKEQQQQQQESSEQQGDGENDSGKTQGSTAAE